VGAEVGACLRRRGLAAMRETEAAEAIPANLAIARESAASAPFAARATAQNYAGKICAGATALGVVAAEKSGAESAD